jgi:hypothetical protein
VTRNTNIRGRIRQSHTSWRSWITRVIRSTSRAQHRHTKAKNVWRIRKRTG